MGVWFTACDNPLLPCWRRFQYLGQVVAPPAVPRESKILQPDNTCWRPALWGVAEWVAFLTPEPLVYFSRTGCVKLNLPA